MPIHDLGYRAWDGQRSSEAMRWWVITGTGIRLAWKMRLLQRFVLLAWLPAVYMGVAFFLYEQSATRPEMRQAAMGFFRNLAGRQGMDFLRPRIWSIPRNARHQVWGWLLLTFFRHPQGVLMALVVGLICAAADFPGRTVARVPALLLAAHYPRRVRAGETGRGLHLRGAHYDGAGSRPVRLRRAAVTRPQRPAIHLGSALADPGRVAADDRPHDDLGPGLLVSFDAQLLRRIRLVRVLGRGFHHVLLPARHAGRTVRRTVVPCCRCITHSAVSKVGSSTWE